MTSEYIQPWKTKMSRNYLAELAGKKAIKFRRPPTRTGITYTNTAEDWDFLAEVLRTTTTLQKLAFGFTQQTRIALQNNKVVDSLAKNRTVKTLSFDASSWSYYDNEDNDKEALAAALAKGLAAAMKENSTIKEIELIFNYIDDEGAAALAAALKVNSSLQELNLGENNIREAGAASIADALKENKSLQTLALCDNQIGGEGAKALAAALKVNSSLQWLDLGYNEIGAEGAKALAAALKVNSSLQELYLKDNQIGDEGAKALAAALKENKSLTKIELDYNQIGVEGAKALAEALKDNKSLTKIELCCNQISAEGAAALAGALKDNKSLQTVDLSDNYIGDEGAKALADALKENITLKTLRLARNEIGEKGGRDILNALHQSGSSSMESIDLGLSPETWNKFHDLINRIQNSIRTAGVDEGQVADEGSPGEPLGDDNERSSNACEGHLTIDTANAYVGDTSNEDAQISTERGGEIAAKETEVKEQELQSTISRLHGELKEKEKEIASLRDILRKIGVMVNSEDGDSNNEGGDAPQTHRGTKSGDRNQREKELQSEIDSLKEQLKNSRPIETVDLTTHEVKRSTATEGDSNEKEPPSKRRRTKSNLANAFEQSQQMVKVKKEAIQRAATAEANAETARREKDAVEASLRDVQEDLEIQQETTEQVAVTLDAWQGRFDRLYELAAASGVDGAVLRSIREGANH